MIGARIHRARKGKAMSLRALGDAVGVSQTMIKKYEDGVVTPSSTMLLALARGLEVGVEYFLRPEGRPLEGVAYRKRAKLRGKRLEAITHLILDMVERRLELEALFPEPPTHTFGLPAGLPNHVGTLDDAERAAAVVRDAWHLGSDPIPSLVDLLEQQGVRVFVVEIESDQPFDGLAATADSMPVVVVAAHWPRERQRFTLAHELGHRVLEGRMDAELSEEGACNRFAGAFLLPRESAVAALGDRRQQLEDREVYLLREEFGLSMSAVLYRARDLGIISPVYHAHQMRRYRSKGWHRQEPGEGFPTEKAHRFEQLVFRAFAEEYIGESKAAELLKVSLREFRSLRALEGAGAPADQ
jgi:Zn-dependent peptidase ImmA (M78 family)/transcriptional regulator with XRE-family HTH domain